MSVVKTLKLSNKHKYRYCREHVQHWTCLKCSYMNSIVEWQPTMTVCETNIICNRKSQALKYC